jgi:3-oxoacyl-[acyl-carrier protein] reductase
MKVLVTGGGTGIGKGIAKALKAHGDDVMIVGRRESVLKACAEELQIEYAVFDVAKDDPDALFSKYPMQALVNNAGSSELVAVGNWTAKHWQDHFDVHVKAPALLSQAFAKQVTGEGSIVNISSNIAMNPEPQLAAYSACKAALISLTKSLAQELASKNIRANAVLPGVVPTAMTLPTESDAQRQELETMFTELHPLGKLGVPQDIAEAVVYLLNAKWVTGTSLVVDGGFRIREAKP